MQQVAQVAVRLENRVAGEYSVDEQQALKVPVYRLRLGFQGLGVILTADRAQGARDPGSLPVRRATP